MLHFWLHSFASIRLFLLIFCGNTAACVSGCNYFRWWRRSGAHGEINADTVASSSSETGCQRMHPKFILPITILRYLLKFYSNRTYLMYASRFCCTIFVLQVAAAKPSAALIRMVVAAWSFLLTTVDERALNPRIWQELVFRISR